MVSVARASPWVKWLLRILSVGESLNKCQWKNIELINGSYRNWMQIMYLEMDKMIFSLVVDFITSDKVISYSWYQEKHLSRNTSGCCPECQRWGQRSQQNREIVHPVKQRWLRCHQQKQRKIFCCVLKRDVVCLHLFFELAKMTERLVFDGEKNEYNALQSYYTAFTLS